MDAMEIIKFRLALKNAGYDQDDLKLGTQDKDVKRIDKILAGSMWSWERSSQQMARKITHVDKAYRRARAASYAAERFEKGTDQRTRAENCAGIFWKRAFEILNAK